MATKTKPAITFRIKRSPRTKQFRCVVQAGNNEVILVGEPCKNRADVRKMILALTDAVSEGRFALVDETQPKLDKSKLNLNWP